MKYEFTHVRLLVNDFPACFRFYRDVLGFRPTYGSETGSYADFDTGEFTLALFVRQEMNAALGQADLPDPSRQDAAVLIFRVEDVDSAVEQLKARGVRFLTAPQDRPDWSIRTAHFRDPDGNLIEINQPLRGM